MNTIKFLASTFICFFFLTACQKEITDVIDPIVDPVIPVGTMALDSTYLEKFTLTLDPNTPDSTDYVHQYYYDTLKRVKALTIYSNEGPGEIYFDTLTFFYNGSDTLPFKMVRFGFDPIPIYNDTSFHFYSYDSQNRKVKDSLALFENGEMIEKKVTRFQHASNSVYGYTIVDRLSQASFEMFDTAVVNTNGDILTNKKYYRDGMANIFTTEAIMTYDNFPSPITRGGLYQVFWNFPTFETQILGYANKTNLLSLREHDIATSANYYETYVYTRNSFGLPQNASVSLDSIPTSSDDRLTFIYRAL